MSDRHWRAVVAGLAIFLVLATGAAAALPAAMAADAPAADEVGIAPSPRSFKNGLRAYVAQDFVLAQEIFLALAALGDGPSMYNLGAMAYRGEGMPKSTGTAVGWWRAAAEAGYDTGLGPAGKLEPRLDAAGLVARDAVLGSYRRERLVQTVLPDGDVRSCRGEVVNARPDGSIVQPDYPDLIGTPSIEALVLATVRVDATGRAHEPRVVFAIPPDGGIAEEFGRESAAALSRTRFTPARIGGKAVPGTAMVRFAFIIEDGHYTELRESRAYRRIVAMADAGHPEASFVVGASGRATGSGGQGSGEHRRLILSAAQAGVPEAQLMVAAELLALHEACPDPSGAGAKARIWLRAAAQSGLPEARTALARHLLEDPAPPLGEIEGLLAIGAREKLPRHVQRELLAIWLASPHASLRNTEAALVMARRYFPGDVGSLLDLELQAAADFAGGRAASAVKRQKRAVDMARANGQDATLGQQRLQAYSSGLPWYGDLLALPVPAASTASGP